MNSITNESVKGVWIYPKIIVDRIDGSFYKQDDIDTLNLLYKSNIQLKPLTDISEDIKDGPHDGYTFVNEGVLFVRSQNIKNAGFDFSDVKYIDYEFHKKFKKSWLNAGDLLITRIGEYYGNSAVVPLEYKGANINHAIAKIKLQKGYNPYYVCAFVNSSIGKKLYRRLGKSFTSPRVNLSDYKELLIPIPSQEIQKYIGDKVRKAEKLREEGKGAINKADEAFNSFISMDNFKKTLMENANVKHNWIKNSLLDNGRLDAEYNKYKYIAVYNHFERLAINIVKIRDLLMEKVVGGSTPKGANYLMEGVPFIRATNLNNYTIDDDLVYISEEDSKNLKGSEITGGDIVLSIAGSIGNASLIPESLERANINQALVRLRLKGIDKYYFLYAINSEIGKLSSLRLANGAVQLNLNREEVENIDIPVLEVKKQEYIGTKIREYIDLIKKSENLIKEAKQDVEALIEGTFDMTKLKQHPESR